MLIETLVLYSHKGMLEIQGDLVYSLVYPVGIGRNQLCHPISLGIVNRG